MDKSSAIITRIAAVTPEIAAAWLEKNTINRPLRRTVVDTLRQAYERGEHRLTHQGIAFASTGELLDGQHRLTAIAQMPKGFSVQIMVTAGLPPIAFESIDQGLKRSHSDVLRIEMGHAAVARLLAVIYNTARTGITSQYLIPFVEGSRPAYTTLMDFCPRSQKLWASAPVRTAAVLRLLNGGDRDYICMAYYSLVHMEFDSMSPVVQTLFKQLTATSGRTSQLDLFARAYKAFDVRNAGMNTIIVGDTAKVAAQTREVISTRVLGMKKAPSNAGAKANKSNSKAKASA
jgi:hypothetical protein